jgi:hypothetical protein
LAVLNVDSQWLVLRGVEHSPPGSSPEDRHLRGKIDLFNELNPCIGLDRPDFDFFEPGSGFEEPNFVPFEPGSGLDRPDFGLFGPGSGLDRPDFGPFQPG